MKFKLPLLLLTAAVLPIVGCAQTGTALTSTKSRERAASQSEVRYDLARLSEKQGNLRQAQDMYSEMLRQNPDDGRALHRLGVISARLDQREQATQYFMQALRNDPHNSEVLTDLGYALYLKQDLTAAETALRQACTDDPGNPRAINNLAIVVGAQGRTDESYALFRRVLGDAQATSNVAYLQAQTGDLGRAARTYSHALTLDQDLEKAGIALLQIAEEQQIAQRRVTEHDSMLARTNPAAEAPVAARPNTVERPVFADEEFAWGHQIRPTATEAPQVSVRPAVVEEQIDNVEVFEPLPLNTRTSQLPQIIPGQTRLP